MLTTTITYSFTATTADRLALAAQLVLAAHQLVAAEANANNEATPTAHDGDWAEASADLADLADTLHRASFWLAQLG